MTTQLAQLNLNLVLDPGHEARAASDLHARLAAGEWATLAGLAAEVLAIHEGRSGSLVLVVPQDRQTAEVARALGAPGLERAMERTVLRR